MILGTAVALSSILLNTNTLVGTVFSKYYCETCLCPVLDIEIVLLQFLYSADNLSFTIPKPM